MLAACHTMQLICLHVVADESLMEVVMDNEEKDLWHAYLQQGNHAMATRYANTQVRTTPFTWTHCAAVTSMIVCLRGCCMLL